MVFASTNFIFLFLPVFLVLYFVFPARAYRNFVLLVFSLIFYAWGEPVYVLLMMFSIAVNYTAAVLIDTLGKKRKLAFVIAVAINLALLGAFKYLDFFIININKLLGAHLPPVGLPLPIGVSFYTFQLISYIADVYAGRCKPQRNPLVLGAYLAGFPQLIAGPIVRYQTIANELLNRRENMAEFTMGVRRFIAGLAKKVIIGNNMAFVADSLLQELPLNYGVFGAWVILLAYALQIYYDFSGYSDMAIGLGRMLGFHYLENFNYPYIAKSVTDFWRRWHISLTTFFREYVYIPMGGNRVNILIWVRNILIVWGLTGLWHGAQWNYVLWGIYYGIILALEKIAAGKIFKKLPAIFAHLYVVFIFLIGWALFRIEDIALLKDFLRTLFGANGWGCAAAFVYSGTLQAHFIIIFFLGVIFATPVALKIEKLLYKNRWGTLLADLWLGGLFILSILLLIAGTYNPFIYYRF